MTKVMQIAGPEDFTTCFNVSRETLGHLVLYEALLRKWQKAVNLVAPSTLEHVWHRHIGDSAQIVDILKTSDSPKNGGVWLDIGSGGGFPGLVAAIMLSENSDYSFHLVESNGRKCAFLSDIVRHIGLPVEIHNKRIEEVAGNAAFDEVEIISVRALAPLDKLLALTSPFVGPSTVSYFFKGREVAVELEQARPQWDFRARQIASRTGSDGCILELTDLVHK